MKKSLTKGNSTTRMLLTPYSIWAVIFILVPLLFIAYYAFTDNNFNFTLDNIARFSKKTTKKESLEFRVKRANAKEKSHKRALKEYFYEEAIVW